MTTEVCDGLKCVSVSQRQRSIGKLLQLHEHAFDVFIRVVRLGTDDIDVFTGLKLKVCPGLQIQPMKNRRVHLKDEPGDCPIRVPGGIISVGHWAP